MIPLSLRQSETYIDTSKSLGKNILDNLTVEKYRCKSMHSLYTRLKNELMDHIM